MQNGPTLNESFQNEQIVEEAIGRFLRLRDGENDISVRRELTAWLRRSPEHVRAYLEVAALWVNIPEIGTGRLADAATLAGRARRQDTVAQFVPQGPHAARPPDIRRRRFAAAAAVLVFLSAGLAAVWQHHSVPTYATGTGEQRTITLADRSTVELNSRSSVQIRFSDEERTVVLVGGQALFRVAKDSARPFVVRSDSARVRALGTAFDVYLRKDASVVTVVEGKVRVEGGSALPVELDAGEQVIVRDSPGSPPPSAPRRVNVAAATAWTEHRLVFESATLAEVVEEFNRHNARPLLLHPGPAADFRISAVFPSADPDSLIRFLRAQPGLRVSESATEVLIAGEK